MQKRVEILVASAPDPTWSFEQLIEVRGNLGWKDFFSRADVRVELQRKEGDIAKKSAGVGCLPRRQYTFRIFEMLAPQQVKVVIVGQDPYPDIENATGVAFSVFRHMKPPPTLNAIYAELTESIPNFRKPAHGDLSYWVMQGVMLLNASLTRNNVKGNEGSHKKMWSWFNIEVLKEILRTNPRAILVFWGKDAKDLLDELVLQVGDKFKHLEASHPSPNNFHGNFKGCGHFVKINEYLRSIGETEIDWQV